MNRRRFSLRYKIAGIMLLVSLIPLLALGGITLRALSAQLGDFAARLQDTGSALREDVVGRNLSAAAADLSAELDAYLLERIRDVRRWSAAPALVQAAQEGTRLALEADLPPNPTP
ncbi:MAG: hypothetical protein ACE5G8_12035, partial [Anaerolineae bacterium]